MGSVTQGIKNKKNKNTWTKILQNKSEIKFSVIILWKNKKVSKKRKKPIRLIFAC